MSLNHLRLDNPVQRVPTRDNSNFLLDERVGVGREVDQRRAIGDSLLEEVLVDPSFRDKLQVVSEDRGQANSEHGRDT